MGQILHAIFQVSCLAVLLWFEEQHLFRSSLERHFYMFTCLDSLWVVSLNSFFCLYFYFFRGFFNFYFDLSLFLFLPIPVHDKFVPFFILKVQIFSIFSYFWPFETLLNSNVKKKKLFWKKGNFSWGDPRSMEPFAPQKLIQPFFPVLI